MKGLTRRCGHKTMVLACLALLGCTKRRDGDAGVPPPVRDGGTAVHASAPAPRKDWCAEHQVPESMCTLCNPKLVDVFRARGDFCEAHGLPESVCPVCSPAPSPSAQAPAEGDGAPADGARVRLKTKEAARQAGLTVAGVRAAGRQTELSTTARIVFDAARVAQVNARSPGVVRSVRADVGAEVHAGAPLAVIESAGVGADQSRLLAAKGRVEVARANHTRLQGLHAEGIAPLREVLTAQQELEQARAELKSVEAALGVVGGTREGGSSYALAAPISGVVTERRATVGRLVGTEEVLFEVVDTSVVWAEVDIPETELFRVFVGANVALVVEGLSGSRSGKLTFIAPAVDLRTRTAKGRVSLSNADRALRGNMFGKAAIELGGAPGAWVVPRSAVQRVRGVELVFVRLAEDLYEVRRVRVAGSREDELEVTGRLGLEDEVVTDGSFLLKTETQKDSIGAGCCDEEERER